MIQIFYQDSFNSRWIFYPSLGQHEDMQKAINALNTFPYSFDRISSQVSIYHIKNLNIKLFDTNINDFVSIESPWKIELNHD